jgi:dGTPase
MHRTQFEGACMSTEVPYLTLDPAIERAIREDREGHWVNPCAFRDENVTRREDNPHDAATLTRPAFARDIEKILNLPAYNRYADKTQVFSLVENDEICRRGLHVQLVSRAARAIGELLGLNTQLIEAIALGHDLGHTPFGHAGERFLSECLEERTGRSFHHNVQSVRVMDRLYRRNISLQTLDGALCHNGEFAQQVLKTGDCTTFSQLDEAVDACTRNASAIKQLRPSTLEGCVVRICDMVAYVGKDRQDAMAMGLIDSPDSFDSDYIGTTNAQILNNLTVDIVNHSYRTDHIALSEEGFRDLVRAKRQNYERIYDREGLAADARNVVQEMFSEMYERLLADLERGDESSPVFLHHVQHLCHDSKSITPEGYLAQDPNTIVVDYISSMTDSYFLALHRHLFPNSTHRVQIRDYCYDL